MHVTIATSPCLAGSRIVALKLAEKRDGLSGIEFVIPFSFSIFGITLVMAAVYIVYTRHRLLMHAHEDCVPGLLAGVFWALGAYNRAGHRLCVLCCLHVVCYR